MPNEERLQQRSFLAAYVALRKGIEVSLDSVGAAGLIRGGKALRLWAREVSTFLRLRSFEATVFSRATRPHTLSIPEKSNWTQLTELDETANSLSGSFRLSKHNGLVFRLRSPSIDLLVRAIRSSEDFSHEELEWLGECCTLLSELSAKHLARVIDDKARWIVQRQNVIKELRPNNLFYNLLQACEELLHHDGCGQVLRFQVFQGTVEVVAEKLYGNRPQRSVSRPPILISIRDFNALTGTPPFDESHQRDALLALGKELFPEGEAFLVSPLLAKKENHEFQRTAERSLSSHIVLLADTRELYFQRRDADTIRALTAKVAPTILESLTAAETLNRHQAMLRRGINRAQSLNEIIQTAASVLQEVFSAKEVTIQLSSVALSATEPSRRKDRAGTLFSTFGPKEELKSWANLSGGLQKATELQAQKFLRPGGAVSTPWLSVQLPSPFVTAICNPIVAEGHLWGIATLFFDNNRSFPPLERSHFDSLAHEIATVVSMQEVADKRVRRMTQLITIMERISAAPSDDAVLETLVHDAKLLLRADYCFVSTPVENENALEPHTQSWTGGFKVPVVPITGAPAGGITSYAAHTGTLYRCDDVRADPYYLDVEDLTAGRKRILSEMAAALLLDGRLLGVIDVMSTKLRAFSVDDEKTLQMLLTQAALALNNARLAREGREHIAILDVLHQRMVQMTNPLEIYQTVLDVAISYLRRFHRRADLFGNLFVRSPGKNYLVVRAHSGPRSSEFSPIQFLGEGVVGSVAVTGAALIIDDTGNPPAGVEYRPFIEGIGAGSEIAVAVSVGNEVIGVLNIESPTTNLFSSKDELSLKALVNEIAVGIRFALFNEEVFQKQQQDLAAREHAFHLVLTHEVHRAALKTAAHMGTLRSAVSGKPGAEAALDEIENDVNRALQVDAQVARFREDPRLEDVDIVSLVRHIASAYNSSAGERVRLHLHRNSFVVTADPSALAFVFHTLIDNSLYAMGAAGTVEILEVVSPNDLFVLRIKDSGHGIKAEHQHEIWKPYFSFDGHSGKRTKPKGLGIGLWLTRFLLSRLEAEITLEASTPFVATVFRIVFKQNGEA